MQFPRSFFKGSGTLTPRRARRLKILIVAGACVVGAVIGMASASMGHLLLDPWAGSGRRIDMEEFQAMLSGGAGDRGEPGDREEPEEIDPIPGGAQLPSR